MMKENTYICLSIFNFHNFIFYDDDNIRVPVEKFLSTPLMLMIIIYYYYLYNNKQTFLIFPQIFYIYKT